MRAFVAIDEISDAMACAVIISLTLLPEELPSEDIELMAGGAGGENCVREGDMTFEHEGEIVALLGGRIT